MMWKIGGPLGEEDGMLYWDGRPVSEIAESFGTPTYVYSEERIRENYRKLRDAFSEHYAKFRISYAVKANSNMSVLNILRDEGEKFHACSFRETTSEEPISRSRGGGAQ